MPVHHQVVVVVVVVEDVPVLKEEQQEVVGKGEQEWLGAVWAHSGGSSWYCG
jgi:hypothetical protein